MTVRVVTSNNKELSCVHMRQLQNGLVLIQMGTAVHAAFQVLFRSEFCTCKKEEPILEQFYS